MDEALIIVNRDLHVVFFNHIAATWAHEFFNIRLAKEYSIVDALTNPSRLEWVRQMYDLAFSGKTQIIESNKQTIQGSLKYFHSTLKPVYNENRAIIAVSIIIRDITAPKEIEQTLRKGEHRWRFALEGSNQGVWNWNILTGEAYYSPGWKKILGYEESEIGNTLAEWQSRLHPDDQERLKKHIEEHLSAVDDYYESIQRLEKKDGSYVWVLSRGMIIERATDNTPLRMIGVLADITEYKNNEEYYRLLFYNNPLPCIIYDVHTHRFLEVNNAAVSFYGYSQEEFLSMQLHDLQSAAVWTSFSGNKVYEAQEANRESQWKHIKKGGEEVIVEVSSNTLSYKGVLASIAIINDITAKVKTEEELQKSHERFQLAAKAASEGLWEWDIEKDEVYISPVYEDMFGFPIDSSHKYEEWHYYIHPDDQKEVITDFYRTIEDPHKFHWQREYRYLKADGRYLPVMDHCIIQRNDKGEATKVVGAIQDISKRKETEQQLWESNERYKLASKATSDALYDWNIKTNELVWGEGITTLFGYQPEEISIAQWENLIYPEDRKWVVDTLYHTIFQTTNKYWKEEYRFRNQSGQYNYVWDRGIIIRDKEGIPLRMIGAMQDVTEQKEKEELVALENYIFKLSTTPDVSINTVFDSLLKGIEAIQDDLHCSVLLLRDNAAVELLAAPRLPDVFRQLLVSYEGNVKEKKFITSLFSHSESCFVKGLLRNCCLAQAGFKAYWSYPVVHSEGKTIGSLVVFRKKEVEPVQDERVLIERIQNIIRILLESHLAVEQIKIANERFDCMMKATHDMIWDWNMETNVFYRNKEGVRKVFGLEDDSSIQDIEKWLTHIHPQDYPRVKHIFDKLLNAPDQDTFEVEYRFKRDDGTYSHVYDRGIIIRNKENKPVRMIGAAQDVTTRKKLEQQLLAKKLDRQRAINKATIETQEQERSEIGKELHDNVNQILTTTKLYLELAGNNPELKDELIRKSNQNIVHVINEIRHLSRSLMNPSIDDLGLIDTVKDLTENINITRKLHVAFKGSSTVEALLSSNEKLMLYRIIQESLNNIIRHAQAKSARIHLNRNEDRLMLTIQDDGKGFNPETTKKGAGLKNIQNRVYLIGGSLKIVSSRNKGCRIDIEIPIKNI
ncbi:MAG: PAS domain-containing protein [Flavisolibacter sp.]|nr:PAS domain-containing protein [Flavisolibacter sp.]